MTIYNSFIIFIIGFSPLVGDNPKPQNWNAFSKSFQAALLRSLTIKRRLNNTFSYCKYALLKEYFLFASCLSRKTPQLFSVFYLICKQRWAFINCWHCLVALFFLLHIINTNKVLLKLVFLCWRVLLCFAWLFTLWDCHFHQLRFLSKTFVWFVGFVGIS